MTASCHHIMYRSGVRCGLATCIAFACTFLPQPASIAVVVMMALPFGLLFVVPTAFAYIALTILRKKTVGRTIFDRSLTEESISALLVGLGAIFGATAGLFAQNTGAF